MNVALTAIAAIAIAAAVLLALRLRTRRVLRSAPPVEPYRETYVGGTSLLAAAEHDDLGGDPDWLLRAR